MRYTSTRSLVAGIAFTLAAGSAGARDFNRLLEGDYIYSGPSSCVFSPAGFNAAHQPLGQSFVNTYMANGIRTFNGDGTGTMNARAVAVSPGGASSNVFSGDFTYELAADLSIVITSLQSTSTSVTPQAGVVSSVTDVPLMKGRVSEDLSTIVVMQDPGVELLRTAEGVVMNQRICARERTLVRVKRGRGH